MLPGFSALTSSTQANWAAAAIASRPAERITVDPRGACVTGILGIVQLARPTSAGLRLPSAGGRRLSPRAGGDAHMASSVMVGESLVGEGNEVAHIDLIMGSKDGPVGEAFANALVNQKEGHTNLLAVVAPNLPAKPDTIISNKVTIKGATQAVQMFGPAQAAVSRAVVDSVREGVIDAGQADD